MDCICAQCGDDVHWDAVFCSPKCEHDYRVFIADVLAPCRPEAETSPTVLPPYIRRLRKKQSSQ